MYSRAQTQSQEAPGQGRTRRTAGETSDTDNTGSATKHLWSGQPCGVSVALYILGPHGLLQGLLSQQD